MQQIILFLRSLIFSVFSISMIFVFSFICLASFLLPLRWRFVVLIAFSRLYLNGLRVICGVNYTVEGVENIPTDRSGVILCKHQSTWETFLVPIYFNQVAALAKRELMWIPFFGWGLAASRPIAIDRSNKSSAMQQIITKGSQFIKDGRWIMVFPEGTRIPVGQVGKYHLGGARLAVATEAPVVPIAHNAGYFWPRRKFIKYPGTIRVVIGPVIESKGRTPEEVMSLAQDWIESTVVKIGGRVDKPAG